MKFGNINENAPHEVYFLIKVWLEAHIYIRIAPSATQLCKLKHWVHTDKHVLSLNKKKPTHHFCFYINYTVSSLKLTQSPMSARANLDAVWLWTHSIQILIWHKNRGKFQYPFSFNQPEQMTGTLSRQVLFSGAHTATLTTSHPAL